MKQKRTTVFNQYILELKKICFDILYYNHLLENGIIEYISSSHRIVHKYMIKKKSNKINNISLPQSIRIEYLDELFKKYEEVGINNIYKCGFVLVAGGIGERLNFDSIKVYNYFIMQYKLSLNVDQVSGLSYLNLYFRYMKSYQICTKHKILICIMTSLSTHLKIKHYLEENEYFGLNKNQIFIIKQINVPSFCDNDCNLLYENSKIVSKPHGHGDIHDLLYSV